MKKRWIPAAIVLFLFLLSGCSGNKVTQEALESQGDAMESGEKPRIGMSFDSFVIERWIRDRDVFVSAARELGADVIVQNANGDVAEQISQIRYLIQKKADVLVIIAADCSSLSEVLEEAKAEEIPVIAYDRLILDSPLDLYVTFDNEKVGALMAESLVENIPDGGEIFMIQGPEEDNNVSLIRKGFLPVIENSGLEVVYETGCPGWISENAVPLLQEGLEKHPDVKGIMCGNDDIATQVIRVLSEEQLAGDVFVVGQDGDLAACQRIVEGTQAMTAFKSVEDLARAAAEYAVKMAKGEKLPDVPDSMDNGYGDIPALLLEPVAVTRANMKEVIIDGGVHSLEDVYLNVRERGDSQ